MKGLIVTADDFGAALDVNEAVEIAHQRGVLTTASLMVAGQAAADAVRRARRLPGLRVGLHLVLVEGAPLLPPEALAGLVDKAGRFRSDMARAATALFFSPRLRRRASAEVEAQFDAFAATGLRLDHVTVHKHYHLHPTVAGLVLAAGARHGLRSARVPLEPEGVLAAADPAYRPATPWLTGPWAALTAARFRAAGVHVPDHSFGLRWSGAMTAARLQGLVRRLPDGISEIFLHPAMGPAFPGSAPGYGYAAELDALLSGSVREAVAVAGARLGGFADFLGGGAHSSAPMAVVARS